MENLDYETKIKILKKICKKEDSMIDDNLLNIIAQNLLNKEDLLDVVKKSKAIAQIAGKEITEEIVLGAIEFNQMYKEQQKMFVKIKTTVEKYFNVNFINYPIKDKEIKYERNIAIYLMREIADISIPKIAREFGIDNASVFHIYHKVKDEIIKNDNTKKIINKLRRIITEV